MTLTARLCATTALASLALATPGHADVTADDVWQNLKAYMDAFGGTASVQTARNGDVLTVGDISMAWMLPLGAGRIEMAQSGFDLIENRDGTVNIGYADTLIYSIKVELPEAAFSGTIAFDHDNMFTTASGTPGDVTYTFGADRIGLELSDFDVAGGADIDVDFSGHIEALAGTTQITVASLVTATSDYRGGVQDFSGRFSDPVGMLTEFSGGAADFSSSSSMVVPRGGMDIMNLAAAMRQGLRITGTSRVSNYKTRQVVTQDGQVFSEQTNEVGQYDTTLGLNGDQILLDTTAKDATARVNMPAIMPVPIEMAATEGSARLVLPVSAGDDLQDASIAMTASGVTISEDIWSMFDPGQSLSRDPATLRLDLSGKVKSFWNWFDFMDVAARGQRGELPGELHAMTLNDLTVELAGAQLTGSGAASFDNSDTVTFGGFPKPTGVLDLTLTGGNALLDQLVNLGLLPQEQAMGARMMVGMVAKPDPAAGEDVLKSQLELTEDGQVLANGVRLR